MASWDYDKPLAIAETLNEGIKAHAALVAYYELGIDRSYVKLAALLGKKPGYTRFLESWASRYDWRARVARAQELDVDERRRLERQVWLGKQTEWRSRLEGLAAKLAARADEMLEQPWYADKVTRSNRVIKDGAVIVEQTIIRQPVKTLPRDAAAFADTASKLAKLAVGLADAPAVSLNISPDDLAGMTDEQLAETIARLREGL